MYSSDVNCWFGGQVAQTVSEIFAEMIFIFGDVHCDPHEVLSHLLYPPVIIRNAALYPELTVQ